MVVATVGVVAIVGAIGGSLAGVATTGAVTGALTGAGSAAAVTSASAGAAGIASSAATTVAALSGPIGWLVLGTEESRTHSTYTYDCWKPLLHDESSNLSHGKLLKDVAADSRIKQMTVMPTDDPMYPQIIFTNIWHEQYRIDYVHLPGDQLAAHAVHIWNYTDYRCFSSLCTSSIPVKSDYHIVVFALSTHRRLKIHTSRYRLLSNRRWLF